MASMMIREPRSFPDIVARVRDAVGAAHMAAACDVSESMVHAWADPGRTQTPSVKQGAILDGLMMAARGDMPFSAEMMRRAGNNPPPPVGCVMSEFMDLPAALGHLADAIQTGKCPKGPGGKNITPNELDAILRAARGVIASARDVKEAAIKEATQ
jgi:hypothetical protein